MSRHARPRAARKSEATTRRATVFDETPIELQVVGHPMPWRSYSPSSATRRGYVPDDDGRRGTWCHAIGGAWLRAPAAARRRAKEWRDAQVALEILVCFRLRRPKSNRREHATTKPDRSNLLKLLEDELTRAGVWLDDSYVVKDSTFKRWARPGEEPGATVLIRPYTAL